MSGLFGVLGVYWVGVATTFGMSTGVPAAFSIEPATLRQGDKDVTTVLATVTLQSPSPAFFVCALRSADKQKIDFATIIFRKGQTTGEAPGYVHWHSILKDVRVRVTAYSTDAPDRQLAFTVLLKPKPAEETESPSHP